MKSKILAEFSLSFMLSLSSLIVVAVPKAHANSIDISNYSSSVNIALTVGFIIYSLLVSKMMKLKRI